MITALQYKHGPAQWLEDLHTFLVARLGLAWKLTTFEEACVALHEWDSSIPCRPLKGASFEDVIAHIDDSYVIIGVDMQVISQGRRQGLHAIVLKEQNALAKTSTDPFFTKLMNQHLAKLASAFAWQSSVSDPHGSANILGYNVPYSVLSMAYEGAGRRAMIVS